jgi:hypothetical protein
VAVCRTPCFRLKPVCGLPYSQDTDSGPRAHIVIGNEPACGAIILSLLLVVVELSGSLTTQEPKKVLLKKISTWQAPSVAMLKNRERPSPMLKTSMTGPLGGDTEGPGAPTTYIEDVDGGPLGGDAGGPGAPTTYVEDVDVGAP